MSEVSDILDRFNQSCVKHWLQRGNPPKVIVIGKDDFDSFLGAVVTIYDMDVPCPNQINGFEFMGISIFKCYTTDKGFFPGDLD